MKGAATSHQDGPALTAPPPARQQAADHGVRVMSNRMAVVFLALLVFILSPVIKVHVPAR